MIDKSKAKWDFSKEEKAAIKWFDLNGFTGEIVKQYISKTIFDIEKSGVKDRFELPLGANAPKNINAYMKNYGKAFHMKEELEELRKGIGA